LPPQLVDSLILWRMPVVLRQLHVLVPNMKSYDFLMRFTLRTLAEIGTGFAISRIALVFSIPLAIGGTVFQDLIGWAKDAIIILVIYNAPFRQDTDWRKLSYAPLCVF
jgi:hypothetical protein